MRHDQQQAIEKIVHLNRDCCFNSALKQGEEDFVKAMHCYAAWHDQQQNRKKSFT